MMRAAADAASEAAYEHVVTRPLVIGVTVLTSLGDADLAEVGVDAAANDHALRLAVLAKESGLDGVVCSPREAARIRAECGPNFKLITPGVRPDWAATNDQKRIMTPEQAVAEGADYLVIGRPITASDDPAAAAQRIVTALAA
jgi:orotidine-5'-phosphate decarboxylase